jgi:hypothetical protein
LFQQAFPQITVLSPIALRAFLLRFSLLLRADGSSLENSSQAKFIDVFGLIVPIADGVCEDLLTRPEKGLGAAGLPHSEEVELFHHGKYDDRSDGFRVMASRAGATPELSARQPCERN